MTRSQKQMTVLAYLLSKYPDLTVGTAARLLNQWEFRTGNCFDIKG